jgi:hypothetical protein
MRRRYSVHRVERKLPCYPQIHSALLCASSRRAIRRAIHINILDFRARVLASRLREGRDEEVTCADRGRCSSRTVFEEARMHTGLHIIEARRRFL